MRPRIWTGICILALALLIATAATAQEVGEGGIEGRLLRFPDIHGDTIAFVYAGDIWLVAAGGGTARRLTSHPGRELFPKFSPDGRRVAFSGEYGGSRQIYVVSVEGGAPRQLTFYNDVGPLPPRGGFDYQVLDWTPDGEYVIFRANRLPWSPRMGRPYRVPAAGGMEEPLPVPEGGTGMLSPDGKRFLYTPIAREFRTWKRYRGGRDQDIWVFNLEDLSAEELVAGPAQDNQPVWVGEKIYFTSDREHKLNLYRYDPEAPGQARRVTDFSEYDVLWPSAGPRRIVFENGGYLYRFDPETERAEKVEVRLYGDLPETLPRYVEVASAIQGMDLSPSGARALFEAWGEVWTVPAKKGEARNLTRTPGARETSPAWSPDGRWVAWLGDASGEYEIYVAPQDGSGEARRVTRDGDTWRFPPVWSPDSRKLAFADKRQRLRWVDVESGEITDVDRGVHADITVYRWSADSRWLAYEKASANGFTAIWVYGLEEGRPRQLTGDAYNDHEPVFDPRGRYLYFLSDRDFNLTFSDWEFTYLYTEPTRVYAGILAAGGAAPFPPESDEEEPGGAKEDGEDGEDGEAAAPPRVRIDVEGFDRRVSALPGVAPGDYQGLAATAGEIYYLAGENPPYTLKRFKSEKRKEQTVLAGVADYRLAAGGEKVLYQRGEEYGIFTLEAVDEDDDHDPAEAGKALEMADLRYKLEPKAAWGQMFTDAWRILRDWFYDPGLHGVDWQLMRRRYGALVPHVGSRADLDYILGELGGELNAGHVYVQSAPGEEVERIEGGLLGAEIEAHPSGYFRVARIFPGENWHEEFRSPLTEPGVEVAEGDFILAVDGRSTRGVDNFYRLLENTAGRAVTLRVSPRPEEAGAREVVARPVASESGLRYLDWVESRRRRVEEASGGRVGYIHLPNTAVAGNRELFKGFYRQALVKDALIFDARYNGGGFIPATMIELVSRPLLNLWARRGLAPAPTPGFHHRGPKVCLINGYSASGGDAFPYYFRALDQGPLIGARTWGGLIGLSGNPPLLDGGAVLVPTFRFLSPEGEWAVENEGVAPDIEVVDRPDLVARGQDPTLERAVRELMEELEARPVEPITPPPTPRDEHGS